MIAGIRNCWRPWKPPLAWAVGALFIVAVTGVAVAHELHAEQGGDGRECKQQLKAFIAKEPAGKPAVGHPKRGAKIAPVGPTGQRIKPARMTFTFNKNREPLVDAQAFRVPRAMNPRAIRVGALTDLADDNGDGTVSADHLMATVSPSSVGHRFVTVRVCVDPDNPHELGRGQYAGSLVVQGPQGSRVRPSSIAIAVSVHDNHHGLALFAVLIGVFAGLVIRSIGDLRKMTGPTTRERVKTYVYSLAFLVMVVAGLLAGVAAYLTIFANDFNATTETDALIALAGAAFTESIAAKTLTDIPAGSPEKEGPPQPPPRGRT